MKLTCTRVSLFYRESEFLVVHFIKKGTKLSGWVKRTTERTNERSDGGRTDDSKMGWGGGGEWIDAGINK